MNATVLLNRSTRVAALLTLIGSLAALPQAVAQPTIVSTVPTTGASDVSRSGPFVFTFSTPMNPDATSAQFRSVMAPLTPLPITESWSANNTQLTATPTSPFPATTMILWTVTGEDPQGNPLEGGVGYFTTGTSSGGGGDTGSGTNRITVLVVGQIFLYGQDSPAAPVLDPTISYGFQAGTTLASNRTATAVSLTMPTGALTNLMRNPFAQESFSTFAGSTNLTSFQAAYPNGDYVFNIQATASNQQVTVNLPASLTQPPAPHLNNYAATQTVDPTQPFSLGWDAFAGGTAADFIAVEIGDVFSTESMGTAGALEGTATSVSIPAGTLAANTNYNGFVTFYHFLATTNSTYATEAYRATSTQFTLTTAAGGTPSPLVLTNVAWSDSGMSFEVTSSVGQAMAIEYSTTLQPGSWSKLLSTNSTTGRVKIADPDSKTDPSRSYRARTGN